MKYRYVFLLGRPGCGKSTLYRELEKRILDSDQARTFERVDDFPRLWARLRGDDDLEKEGKERIYSTRTDDGAYFPNDSIWNELLKEVNADVLNIDKPNHMIFLEFARPSYIEALQNFDHSILDNCVAIYMEVNFDICWARNVARHEADMSQDGDDHMVYRETMEKLYLYDDQDAFVQHMKDRNIPVAIVNNEAEGKEHLHRRVEELFDICFQGEQRPASDVSACERSWAVDVRELTSRYDAGERDFEGARLQRAKLPGIDLSGANLRDARLASADLRKANLDRADLRQADLHRAKLGAASLRQANLFGANLADAHLCKSRLNGSDLRQANLDTAELSKSDLSDIDLTGACLCSASLSRADLSGGKLAGADLHQANLLEADLSDANLAGTCLHRASLPGTNLRRANLPAADLGEADLSWARLDGASLVAAKLNHAKLIEAQLPASDLTGADLIGANLSGSDLTGANLNGADLRWADLRGASLQDADLRAADLRGANLSRALVTQDQIDQASSLTGATLPQGVTAG